MHGSLPARTASSSTAPVTRRRLIAKSAAGAAGLLLGAEVVRGTRRTAKAQPRRGGRLTTAMFGTDARSFHPGLTTDTPSSTYQGYVYGASLLRYSADTLEVEGHAARALEFSTDRRSVTFHLKDIEWSDGVPITAADYAWTFEQLRKPENKYPYVTNLEQIDSVEALEPRVLRVSRLTPTPILESYDVVTPLPRHIWEQYPWADPVRNPEIMHPTVGSGMWLLHEWRRNERATFTRNERYFDGPPHIDTLTVRVLPPDATARDALASGEIDLGSYHPLASLGPPLANVNVYEWYAARGSWTYLGFNFRRPALQDVRVRRAIARATDQRALIDMAASGLARPIFSVYPQSSWAYTPDVTHYPHDLDLARELLREAGYSLDNRGRRSREGLPLSLTLLYHTGNFARAQIAFAVREWLQELGITVEMRVLEFQAFLDALKREPYDYDLFVLGWNATLEPQFMQQIWSESQIPTLNSGAYVNKEVERLYAEAEMEFDRERRRAIYHQIQRILADDLPYVFLYEGLSYTAVNKRIKGIRPTRLGISYNMNEWYIEEEGEAALQPESSPS
jgi:peptide/nickel transport system substrate-binding protein